MPLMKMVLHPCEVHDFTYEYVYPFGNYKSEYYDKFGVFVQSPSLWYYSELFGSFLLNPDEAWTLYKYLFYNQQCQFCKRKDSEILEEIPDHLESFEEQFKAFYEVAYFNVVKYFNSI